MNREPSLNQCPFCGAAFPLSGPIFGQAICPRCRGRLWQVKLFSGMTYFVQRQGESIYDLLADLADPTLGLTASEIESTLKDADSLDAVEFLLQIRDSQMAARS